MLSNPTSPPIKMTSWVSIPMNTSEFSFYNLERAINNQPSPKPLTLACLGVPVSSPPPLPLTVPAANPPLTSGRVWDPYYPPSSLPPECHLSKVAWRAHRSPHENILPCPGHRFIMFEGNSWTFLSLLPKPCCMQEIMESSHLLICVDLVIRVWAV